MHWGLDILDMLSNPVVLQGYVLKVVLVEVYRMGLLPGRLTIYEMRHLFNIQLVFFAINICLYLGRGKSFWSNPNLNQYEFFKRTSQKWNENTNRGNQFHMYLLCEVCNWITFFWTAKEKASPVVSLFKSPTTSYHDCAILGKKVKRLESNAFDTLFSDSPCLNGDMEITKTTNNNFNKQ